MYKVYVKYRCTPRVNVLFSVDSELINLDVMGFLVYQGYRNCEALAVPAKKGENTSLIKYRQAV